MTFTLTLPDGYQYVAAALLSTGYLLAFQAFTVGRYRRRAGVKYPQAYGEKAEQEKSIDVMKFNCAQRAHQNTLEVIPVLYMSTILSGLKHPHFAAAACMAYVFGRIAFTRGYLSGDPDKRKHPLSGLGSALLLVQILSATSTVGGWLIPGLCAKTAH